MCTLGRFGRSLAVFALVVTAGGCGSRSTPAHDLDLGAARSVFCADRLRWGTVLEPGQVVQATLPAGQWERLEIDACAGDERARPLVARLEVTPQGGASVEVAVEGWHEVAVDLDGATTTIALRALDQPVLIDQAVVHAPLATTPPRRRGRGVVLVSFDTLRADALGAYGGPPTPAFDRLAAASEVHLDHTAAASWTKPSHATLLTGQPPEVHGAIDAEAAIHPGVTTLAERFAAAGWRTGGLVRHVWLDAKFGFDRGFETWQVVDSDAGEQVREAVRWVDRHAEERYFYFLHVMTAHSDFHHLPYEGPGVDRAFVRERWDLAQYGCREERCASVLLEALGVDVAPLEREPAVLRTLYAAGVAEVDAALGELVAGLELVGALENTTLIVTADHGEELLDHGRAMHRFWWQEVLRVPLLIRRPGTPASRVAPPSSSLDLVATIAAEAGLARDGLAGVPIAERRRDRPVFAGVDWRVTRQGDDKLVEIVDGEVLLFDLGRDRGELDNRAARAPERVAALQALRGKWLAGLDIPAGAAGRVELTAEEAAELRALGYLGD